MDLFNYNDEAYEDRYPKCVDHRLTEVAKCNTCRSRLHALMEQITSGSEGSSMFGSCPPDLRYKKRREL